MRHTTTVVIVLALMVEGSLADAYDPDTHRELAVRSASARSSTLDQRLKVELGLSDGIATAFPGTTEPGRRAVDLLIGDGALSEDIPSLRSLNHFHNPLIDPWDDAGLRAGPILGTALVRGQSSVLWQQNRDQPSTLVFTPVPLPSHGGRWSWQDARRRYLAALTRPRRDDAGTEPGRDRAFGELFETLGHLTHLVQDAFVPAHARNDAHPPRVRSDWYEQWVEETRVARPDRFAALLNGAARGPAPSIFTATLTSRAPVPVARLIDADVFRAPADGGVLGDEGPGIGAAEYTNGNFLSRGTLFRRFELPRAATLDVGPIVEETPGTFRRYFTKSRDGAAITHFVTDGMLFDALAAAQAGPVPSAGWMLDDRIHEDYAGVLLPRAVGYGAALLDYFFRGRLDVDLVDDGGGLRLVGTNASADPLDGGTLTLYADDGDGVRRPASESVAVGRVEPGDPLPAVTVTPPAGAERFVAVYTGTLGNEASSPDQSIPGGVIGKVLGGVRVEEVFLEQGQWNLRTPKGVYGLRDDTGPLTANRYEKVAWGDGRDSLVARTPIGAADPPERIVNLVVAYEIPRTDGTSLDPVVDSTNTVALITRRTQELPFGAYLGTTVRFRQSRPIPGQEVMRVRSSRVWTFNPACQCDIAGDFTFEPPTFDVLVPRQTIEFNRDFPVILDRAHGLAFPKATFSDGYVWDLLDVGADRAGRPLGLVVVYLSDPGLSSPPFPQYCPPSFTEVCGTGGVSVPFPGGISVLLWVVLDLSTGEVVASTADPVVSITSALATNSGPQPTIFWPNGMSGFLQQHTNIYSDGRREEFDWAFTPFQSSDLPVASYVDLEANSGYEQLSMTGLHLTEIRGALAQAGLSVDYGLATEPTGEIHVYGCRVVSPPTDCSALRSSGTSGRVTQAPVGHQEAIRSRPAPSGERLVLMTEGGQVLVWDQAARRAQVRYRASGAFSFPVTATSTTALIRSGVFVGPRHRDISFTSTLVALEGPASPIEFPGVDLGAQFALLDPGYLYSVGDLKFFRYQGGLQRTMLPATLAEVPGNPRGDYHTIRLP